MKQLILAALAAASLAAALPAAAQEQPYSPFSAREAADARRISWCVSHGAMSAGEAGRLYTELRRIARQAEGLAADGLSRPERFYIMRRLSQLERDINLHCIPRLRPSQEPPRLRLPDPGPYRSHDRFDRYDRFDRGADRLREQDDDRPDRLQRR